MSPYFNAQIVPIEEVPEEDVDVQAAAGQPVVLIVDDEPLVADTLSAILSKAGYATRIAYDGYTALQIASTIEPQLLITDVAMPRMNGVELALAMVSMRPACKILLFSGHATSSDLIHAYDAGHDFPLLTKPVHPTEMLREVSHRLSLKQRVRKSFGKMAEIVSTRGAMDCA